MAILSGSDNLDAATTKLAEQAGIDPELAADYVYQGHAMFERVVAREVTKAGLDPSEKEAFYEWCRESRGKAMQHAIQQLTMARNVTPFVHLAHEYRTRAKKS